MVIEKIKQSNLKQTHELQNQSSSFKATLIECLDMLKRIFDNFAKSIQVTFDLIE